MDSTTDQEKVSLGEVYRRLCAMDDRHGEQLAGINTHLGTLNSKVAEHATAIARHEVRMDARDIEIRDMKRTLQAVPDKAIGEISALVQGFQQTQETAAQRRDDVISIPVNSKTLTALVLTCGAIIAAVILAVVKG